MFIFIGPPVRHFSDGNQTVCPKLKKQIMPKCRERCFYLIPFTAIIHRNKII
jgi:hypothetical protein